jgi:glyoxylase-like metal-dependent hydrolase (beta-lactamase superfamily II)
MEGDCKVTGVSRAVDVRHLGRDRVICAYELDGLVVDPGPSSSVAALDGIELRSLLLTHIHLDHAGATGVLVRENPDLRVYVHERGAPHLVDPSKLLASAAKLYGDDMERLWGEVVPVPEENIVALSGGETVEGFRVAYTPGHASHHVCYLQEDTGHAYVGDVAGVRIPPSDFTLAPTPPPDIDIEAWLKSIELVESWSPSRLCLTHFGPFDDVGEHLERVRAWLSEWSRLARELADREAFCERVVEAFRSQGDEDVTQRLIQAAPPDQLYLGYERYWRKRAEREATAA